MATPTYSEIQALDFGYLSGTDLLKWANFQYLAKQESIEEGFCLYGVQMAYAEIQSKLNSRYDLTAELAKTGTDRNQLLVKIISVLAVWNILGTFAGVGEHVRTNFDWANKTLLAIRNGQESLINVTIQGNTDTISTANIIQNSFYTIG